MSNTFDVLNGALNAMQRGPRPLSGALRGSALINGYDEGSVTAEGLRDELTEAPPGDHVATAFRTALARWDNASDGDWIAETRQNCAERRARIYELLRLDADFVKLCDQKFEFKQLEQATVIAREHTQWYTDEIRRAHSFYWDAYSAQLTAHGWAESAVRQLDDSTTRVVERLADPSSEAAYQTKGLVVGYVQSGKTANFTGVIAKAADAGYKLIIVLAGTLDVLRSQTQRRIDKEMIGQELLDNEYVLDDDWEDFLSHGAKPSAFGQFDWYRLTGPESDYQKLARGVEALQFEAADPGKPLWHKDNLFQTRARIAILKKHPAVLKRLLSDLRLLQRRGLGASLNQIPALIIDDESDQAGINTLAATSGTSSTNKAIVDLLRALPRSQYVGYTATPFANVFIDPSNEADIFPKDFLLSLPRPDQYMGVSDFYDLDGRDDDPTSRPNEHDFVRPVTGRDEDADNLVKAIDSYVLAGAIKLYRASRRPDLKFRHHTMLAHVSFRMSDHDQLSDSVRAVFSAAAYDGRKGRARLRALFESDFRPVTAVRGAYLPFPAEFDELATFVGDTLGAIGAPATAVRILNTDNKESTPDFDKESVWKILVGGNKLSRGYTVEGLTTSYYRRKAATADTLMQMGRWFGFRRGYGDLVRLFIGTDEPLNASGSKRINLYKAFGAVCRDEEAFREELKRYASMEDRITPLQVPPLVPSHMLRPTASNKMFNARVTYNNFGGRLSESTFAPDHDDDIKSNHAELLKMIGTAPIERHTLAGAANGATLSYVMNTAILSPADMIAFLKAFRWSNSKEKNKQHPMELQIEFLQKTGARDPQIDDWLLMAPQITSPVAGLKIRGVDFGVIYRDRTETRFGTYNDPKHRVFAEDIAYGKELQNGNDAVRALRKAKRGVMLYYPVSSVKNPAKAKPPFSTGFTLLFPKNNIRSPITFEVIRPDLSSQPIVPATP